MAVGLDLDTEFAERAGIPSGGAGTLSQGGFSDFFEGVWLYRPSSGNSYGLTSDGSILHLQAGAREMKLGFDNTFGAGTAADPLLQVIFNSGGGTGAVQTFSGANFLDEWVYYFLYENAANDQVAGYIRLSDLSTAFTISRANDNAGSQYINTINLGNASAHTAVAFGHYAYHRARDSAASAADVLTYAASTATITGDWAFHALPDASTPTDTSGNTRPLTFGGTLSNESDPTFPPVITAQPTDQTTNAAATATFSVTATGATSYQWQDNSGGSFANISGATSSSYAATSVTYSMQGRLYRCNVTNSGGTTTSASAALRVAFNLAGTGPRVSPLFGAGPFAAGSFGEFVRGIAVNGLSYPANDRAGALESNLTTKGATATVVDRAGARENDTAAKAVAFTDSSTSGARENDTASKALNTPATDAAGTREASTGAKGAVSAAVSIAGTREQSVSSQAVAITTTTSSRAGARGESTGTKAGSASALDRLGARENNTGAKLASAPADERAGTAEQSVGTQVTGIITQAIDQAGARESAGAAKAVTSPAIEAAGTRESGTAAKAATSPAIERAGGRSDATASKSASITANESAGLRENATATPAVGGITTSATGRLGARDSVATVAGPATLVPDGGGGGGGNAARYKKRRADAQRAEVARVQAQNALLIEIVTALVTSELLEA